MESLESNNIYNLGTTLTTGHLTKLLLSVSQSLLTQELMGCAWYQTTFTTYRQLAQLFGGFAWNHGIGGITGITRFFATLGELLCGIGCGHTPPAPLYLRGGGDSGITGISGIKQLPQLKNYFHNLLVVLDGITGISGISGQ